MRPPDDAGERRMKKSDVEEGARARSAPRRRAPRRREGRPSILTAELAERFSLWLRAGNYIETAAALAGIARSSVYLWLRRGAREAEGPYREFSDMVRRAMAEAESADLAVIGRAARADWRAAAWRLAHRHPERYGGRVRAAGDDAMDMDGDLVAPSDELNEEELRVAREAVARARAHEARSAVR
jgi:hypothetical protein